MRWWKVQRWLYRHYDRWFARNASEEDIRIIRSQDDKTLAEWSAKLNCFEWPSELPNPEPTRYIRNGRRGQLMYAIDNEIGKKETSRFWNCVHQGHMTPEQFEFWWVNGHEEFHKRWPDYRTIAIGAPNGK